MWSVGEPCRYRWPESCEAGAKEGSAVLCGERADPLADSLPPSPALRWDWPTSKRCWNACFRSYQHRRHRLSLHPPRNDAETPVSGRACTGTAASLCTHRDRSHVEALASRNTDTGAEALYVDSPQGLGCGIVLLLWQLQARASRCPTLYVKFPYMLLRWLVEKRGDHYVMISPCLTTERLRAGNGDWSGMEGQPPGSVIYFDPRRRCTSHHHPH